LPGDAASYQNLGWALYRVGDWNGCVEAREKAMAMTEGGNGWDWFYLAMAHRQLGNKARALGYYDRANAWLEAQPANAHYVPKVRRIRDEAAALLGVRQDR
jgi:tetratricopeptide (TPR) repeat protein